MKDTQRGISLVITFLIMAIMLSVVLSLTSILFSQIKIMSNVGNSISSLYAAESGLERTLYIDKKQMSAGVAHGICNICNICGQNNCQTCTATSLAKDGSNGCNVENCISCNINYAVMFDGRSYAVNAKIDNNIFSISSAGFYRESSRTVDFK